ncbi:MAG TPA: YciI family protein [Solirubrobacterales bacterium]|nr:YciI family protein [Solirubrobacterales bacterium]
MSEDLAPSMCFLYKLIPPRPTFDTDMNEEEASIMGRHVLYWQDLTSRGTAVVFGPVSDPAGVWGLAVIKADDEEQVRTLAERDPAIASGLSSFECHPMPATIVGSRRDL